MNAVKMVLNFAWRAALVPCMFLLIGFAIGAGSEEIPGMAYTTPAVATAASPTERTQDIVVMGDSTGEFVGRAMIGLDVNVTNLALRRCPLRPEAHVGGIRAGAEGEFFDTTDDTSTLPNESCAWNDILAKYGGAVEGATVVIYAGPMMMADYDDGHLPDVGFQLTLVREMRSLVDRLDELGAAKVVIVEAPPSLNQGGVPSDPPFWLLPERQGAWVGVLQVVRETNPSTCYVDYASFFLTQPDNRPDGAHMEGPGATAAAQWILDQASHCK